MCYSLLDLKNQKDLDSYTEHNKIYEITQGIGKSIDQLKKRHYLRGKEAALLKAL
jgi:hypothetical protein